MSQVFIEKYTAGSEVEEGEEPPAPDPEAPPSPLEADAAEALAGLVAIAVEIGKMDELLSTTGPTVIT